MMQLVPGRSRRLGRSMKLGVAVAPADRRILSRVLVASIVVLSIGLTGCGRKATLDPPPSPAVTDDTGAPAPAPAPKKPGKPFFLDWLL